MTSERLQRQVARLLDEAEEAVSQGDWQQIQALTQRVLTVDPDNTDAKELLAVAERGLGNPAETSTAQVSTPSDQPTSFADGRYKVSKFLGEGGKKKVYLAHDATLDRDVAFALIKTEGLDEASRTRVSREAQAMARLGDHPHIVAVYDLGEEGDQPYMVLPILSGDVEDLIEDAPDHKVPMEQALKIARETCLGLEFAHSKGIIHRDLKPGNVMLSEDGTAKIGDFGLAVATDRSRLTQEGMMVGTASYMPPEQALGGEVTAQSDLYSLGAMLYELVTGRPPFIGDESVTIITQHLNTPPVSPTWHNPAISPGLETLIMRLLEKDASKRPASASEVLKALEAVGSGEIAVASDAEAPTGPDPVYRRTFVGRETELRKLEGIFDGAISGNGALVMVVGEPGIGKTSITEQLATYVAMRGGKTLVGHCYEEGSLSLPYLAFVESIRSYVLSREPDDLKQELGTGAGEVARIVSEIRDRVQVELPPAGDPEEDRYRLLQAVTGFLRNASTVSPLMVVLEDLHDADRGTLDMLTHVARNLSGSRLLIIGTYRDVEVDRAHPLSAALAELRRIDSFDRVPLRGLTPDEVQRMVNSVFGHELAPRELAETIHTQTEGNPLFVQEVLRYFVDEGLMERDGSQLRRVGEDPLYNHVPEGLRDVIGRRLTKLSPEANQVLGIASAIGREFTLEVLRRVADLDEDSLVVALESASEVGVLEERTSVGGGVTYRFAHAFFRQTMYEEISGARRIRYHRQVANALEEVHSRRLDDHAVELAEHFGFSSDPKDLEKAVRYGELAAERAVATFAYGEAVHHLEQALDVQSLLDPDDESTRCRLLLSLGGALVGTGQPLKAADVVYEEAFGIADTQSNSDIAMQVAVLAMESLKVYWAGTVGASDSYRQWLDRAVRLAGEDTRSQIAILVARGDVAFAHGNIEEYLPIRREAWALAQKLGDRMTLFRTGFMALAFTTFNKNDFEEQLASAKQLVALDRSGIPSALVTYTLVFAGQFFLGSINYELAKQTWLELDALAERTHDSHALMNSLLCKARMSFWSGNIEEAASLGQQLYSRGDELDLPEIGKIYGHRASALPLMYLGRASEAYESIPLRSGSNSEYIQANWIRWLIPLLLARTGRNSEAQNELNKDAGRYQLGEAYLGATLQTAVLLGDQESIRRLIPMISQGSGRLLMGPVLFTCIDRLLGDASSIVGDIDTARNSYTLAVDLCEQTGFRPELALSRLGLAELLLEHNPDERPEALEHLDFAIAEFKEMKMQPSLERALRHRDILKA